MKGYAIKLVRDRVSEIDTSEGITYRPVESAEEHRMLMRQKVGEEAIEVILAPNLGEFADAFQALINLATLEGHSWADVEAEADRKAKERGTFVKGTVMITVEPEA